MERIASGYVLAEAPVATADGGLFFSDALGGGVYRWSRTTGDVETVIPKRRGVGGMALHADGGLVVSGRDVSHVADGRTRVLFADESAAGFNDLTVDPEGHVVVGVLRYDAFAGEDPVPGVFLRVEDDGGATSVITGVEWPNGCAFSPDGRTFYGCDYRRGVVLAADRGEDGGYRPPRILVSSPSGQVDGLAVDENGALWVALGTGCSIGRFRPDGTQDQVIEVPTTFVASLCFGGADGRDLFITTAGNPSHAATSGGVFLARSPVAGATVTPAR